MLNLIENQITDEMVLIDLNCLLKNGELPGLLSREEVTYFVAGVKSSLTYKE